MKQIPECNLIIVKYLLGQMSEQSVNQLNGADIAGKFNEYCDSIGMGLMSFKDIKGDPDKLKLYCLLRSVYTTLDWSYTFANRMLHQVGNVEDLICPDDDGSDDYDDNGERK